MIMTMMNMMKMEMKMNVKMEMKMNVMMTVMMTMMMIVRCSCNTTNPAGFDEYEDDDNDE